MLLLDPEERVTAVEAVSLPYFAVFREPTEETEAQPYDNSLDDKDLTLDQWKRKDEERREAIKGFILFKLIWAIEK